MSDERLTMREWAAELAPEHKRLSREDAMLLALISTNDRLVHIEGAIEDLQSRYQLLDKYLEDRVEGYRAPEHLRALREGAG